MLRDESGLAAAVRTLIAIAPLHSPSPPAAAPDAPARPGLALALALISIPGVTIAWDIGAVAGFAGTAIGIAAIVLGLQARNRLTEPRGHEWRRWRS